VGTLYSAISRIAYAATATASLLPIQQIKQPRRHAREQSPTPPLAQFISRATFWHYPRMVGTDRSNEHYKFVKIASFLFSAGFSPVWSERINRSKWNLAYEHRSWVYFHMRSLVKVQKSSQMRLTKITLFLKFHETDKQWIFIRHALA